MPDANELFEDIQARLSALEFLVRQIYSAELKRAGGDPLESALATQGRAMMGLRKKFEAMPSGPAKDRISKQITHINRIYEDLVRGLETRS